MEKKNLKMKNKVFEKLILHFNMLRKAKKNFLKKNNEVFEELRLHFNSIRNEEAIKKLNKFNEGRSLDNFEWFGSRLLHIKEFTSDCFNVMVYDSNFLPMEKIKRMVIEVKHTFGNLEDVLVYDNNEIPFEKIDESTYKINIKDEHIKLLADFQFLPFYDFYVIEFHYYSNI